MRGDTIPDDNHISRYCARKHIHNGEIQATAFHLRFNEESLSVNWLEFLSCSDRESEISEIRKIYLAKLNNLKTDELIAVLNVGKVREKVRREHPEGRNLGVLHDPTSNDPSHSGIYHLNPDNVLIAELILQLVDERYPARVLL